jgi:hypothetical protein
VISEKGCTEGSLRFLAVRVLSGKRIVVVFRERRREGWKCRKSKPRDSLKE